MKRVWPIIGVRDVAASTRWYLTLFGQEQRPPGHADFDQVCDDDDTMLACLHEWGGHGEGPPLAKPRADGDANGILLFFRVDDLEAATQRVRAAGFRIERDLHSNEGTRTTEITLRDPDGYYVVLNAAA